MRKLTKVLGFFTAFCLTACSTGTPTLPPQVSPSLTQSIQGPSDSVIYGTLTGNEEYPAVFIHESGERLVIIGEPGADRIRGVVYSSPNTPTMVIYANEQGLPETGYVGEYILLYSNYTDTTVDVTVISPDGSISENPGLEYNRQLLEYTENQTRPITSNISFKTSSTASTKDLFWYLKLGSIVVSVFVCLKLVILAAPLGLACFGAILKIVPEWLKAEHPDSELIQPLEDLGTVSDAAQCGTGELVSCGEMLMDDAEVSMAEAEQTYEKQKRVVEEIKLKSSSSPVEGTLPCSDSRLSPEEQANCGAPSYSFKTEFACDSYTGSSLEKFLVTFSETSVELTKIEPESESWSHLYTEVSQNTFSATYDSGIQVTIEFNMNGFTMLSSAQENKCGKYIRTLIP